MESERTRCLGPATSSLEACASRRGDDDRRRACALRRPAACPARACAPLRRAPARHAHRPRSPSLPTDSRALFIMTNMYSGAAGLATRWRPRRSSRKGEHHVRASRGLPSLRSIERERTSLRARANRRRSPAPSHDEQRHALHPRGAPSSARAPCARCSREVVVAPGDEDLSARTAGS